MSASRLAEAERDIAGRRRAAGQRVLDSSSIALAIATGKTERITDSYRAQYVELPLLDRAAKLIAARRLNLRTLTTRQSLNQETAQYWADVTAYNTAVREQQQRRREAEGQTRYPLCRRAPSLPGCSLVWKINTQAVKLRDERQKLEARKTSLLANRKAIEAGRLASEQVADGAAIIDLATRNYAAQAESLARAAQGSAVNQLKGAFESYGRTAFWLVVSAILLPILHKLFAFWVIAPAAARARPLRLSNDGPALAAIDSGISVEVPIDERSELLLRSGLQSSAVDLRGHDKPVLDWRMPFTSIAAGLVNLQRLRSNRLEHVVVTGTDDMYRVAVLAIPAGGSVVLQPRSLLGLVKPRDARLVITRPWRIWWAISWITLQFRYVVFHGPCTLIVQGRDGVQVEDAARGRMIPKRLTLGFDAALDYGAARSTSFGPYFRGEAGLFNDRFEGTGRYFYEQRVSGAGGRGLFSRGLKGVGDALLSMLGI